MKYPAYKYLYFWVDLIVLVVSFVLAELTSNYIVEGIFRCKNASNLIYYFISSLSFIFIFGHYNLYKLDYFLTKLKHLHFLLKGLVLGQLWILVLVFVTKQPFIPDYRRSFVLSFLGIAVLLFVLIRIYILPFLFKNYLSKKLLLRKVLIVGCGPSAKLVAEKLILDETIGIRIMGFVGNDQQIGERVFRDFELLGTLNDVYKVVSDYKIDEIIVAVDNISEENLFELIEKINKTNVTVKVSSEILKVVNNFLFVEKYLTVPVVDVSTKVNPLLLNFFKRVIDIVLSVIFLVLLLPVLTIIAISIKIDSPGPVILKQVRIGKNGKPFKLYKFRTMYELANDEKRKQMMINFIKGKANPSTTKVIDESRVTRVGRFLRRTSLDELPQLINVLKREMSLVGPRPCLPYEYENYTEWQKMRNTILPGCTGLWQVYGRGKVNFRDSVVLDIYYVNNMTPWLDFQIILKTFPVMVFGKGV
ncbi:MAG: sugar transferase [Ignavibacteria bacterium]